MDGILCLEDRITLIPEQPCHEPARANLAVDNQRDLPQSAEPFFSSAY
jgi:hypothetical protein